MIIKNDERLAQHTTIKIGGIAKEYIVPESIEELRETLAQRIDIVIGGGSNLLIAERCYDRVVDLSSFDKSIISLGDGKYKIGASARLQNVIRRINEEERGGIEYLMSVPGLIGGAVVMNAGRGRSYNACISDYILSVEAIVDGEIQTYYKDECGFEYRNSIFKNSKMIIISAIFQFQPMSLVESERLRKERIDLCRQKQDNIAPNFGSVFMECNSMIMKIVKLVGVRKNKVSFSKKTGNWLLNGGGSYEDALKCIRVVEWFHMIFRQKCEREVIVIE